jgi:hypothetical protein
MVPFHSSCAVCGGPPTPAGVFLTVIIFAAATLIPLLSSTKREAFGPFTPGAEVCHQWQACKFTAKRSICLCPLFLGEAISSCCLPGCWVSLDLDELPTPNHVQMLNGRAAMLGFASLLVVEGLRGGVALF